MRIEIDVPGQGMTLFEGTRKEIILKLLAIFPEGDETRPLLSYAKIAKAVGCSAPYVYYVKNPDKKRENMRQFWRRNPESMKASKRRYEIKKGIYKGVQNAQQTMVPGQDQGLSGNGGRG